MNKIGWCEETWNPITGCTKIEKGCENCYAERIANRFWGKRKFNDIRFHPERLEIPLHWKKPRRIFVCSMGDLFHPDVPDNWIVDIWNMMAQCQQHTFLVLTKRPQRFYDLWMHYGFVNWGNIWAGLSVSTQKEWDEKHQIFMRIPNTKKFISYEPALGQVDFHYVCDYGDHRNLRCLGCDKGIDWLICGAESGAGARHMVPDWARSARDQCNIAGVPFWMKQMSNHAPIPPDLAIKELP